MKRFFYALILACFACASPAAAQIFNWGSRVTDDNPQPVKLVCWNGTAYASCAFGGGGGGAVTQSGTWVVNLGTLNGAATSAKQDAMQTVLDAMNARIGASTSPASGTLAWLLDQIRVAAQDTNPVSVMPKASATTARTSVTGAASSTLLLGTNANRTGCSIVNDSGAILYLGLSTAVSATSYEYVIDAKTTVGGSFECPYGWTGPVYGVWASATGAARIGERSQ